MDTHMTKKREKRKEENMLSCAAVGGRRRVLGSILGDQI